MLGVLKVVFPQWFTPVLWGLVGSTLISVILAAIALLKRIPKKAPELTSKNIEASIRGWLDAFQISTKRLDDSPHLVFGLLATFDNRMSMLIAQQKNLDRYILLQSAISVSPEHKTIFDALPENEKIVFASRLGVEIARTNTTYTLDLLNGSITLVKRVPITANLNEGVFMDALDLVDNAKMQILQTFALMMVDLQKKLPSPPSARKPSRN